MPRKSRSKNRSGRGRRVREQSSSCIVAISPKNSFALLPNPAQTPANPLPDPTQLRTSFGQMSPSAQDFASQTEAEERGHDADSNTEAEDFPRRGGAAGIGGIPNSHYFRLASHGTESMDIIQPPDHFPDFSDSENELEDGLQNFLATLNHDPSIYLSNVSFLPESRAMTDVTREDEEDEMMTLEDPFALRERPSTEYSIDTILPVQFQGGLSRPETTDSADIIDGRAEPYFGDGSDSCLVTIITPRIFSDTDDDELPYQYQPPTVDGSLTTLTDTDTDTSEEVCASRIGSNGNTASCEEQRPSSAPSRIITEIPEESSPTPIAAPPSRPIVPATAPATKAEPEPQPEFIDQKWHERIMTSLNDAWKNGNGKPWVYEYAAVELDMAFSASPNAFSTAAYLMLGADDLQSADQTGTLITYIGIQFKKWYLRNRDNLDLEELLNPTVQSAAFSMLTMQKNADFIPFICELFRLKDVASTLEPDVMNLCKCGAYELAAIFAKILNLNSFDAHAFVIPLILQGYEELTYDYLKGKALVQQDVLAFLDGITRELNPVMALSHYIKDNNVLNLKRNELDMRALRRTCDRLEDLFETDPFQMDVRALTAEMAAQEASSSRLSQTSASSKGSELGEPTPLHVIKPPNPVFAQQGGSGNMAKKEESKTVALGPRKSKYLTHQELRKIIEDAKKSGTPLTPKKSEREKPGPSKQNPDVSDQKPGPSSRRN